MSAFMHDVARASLPVAIALLIFAACARALLWASIDDARTQRVAGQYLEPLGTWSLVAVATQLFALGAAGEAGVLSVAFALALGTAAVLLRATGDVDRPSAVESEEQPTVAAAAPTPVGRLWAEPVNEASTREGRLWSR